MSKFNLITLLSIAEEAKTLCDLDESIRHLKAKYHSKLCDWKADNDRTYVSRDSEEWEAMMLYADAEREAYQRARKEKRNTMRRLKTATKKVSL